MLAAEDPRLLALPVRVFGTPELAPLGDVTTVGSDHRSLGGR